MGFSLSATSERNLRGVHPDLVRVVRRAITITPVDFRVIEGARSVEQQRKNVRNGVSWTMNSRHIRGSNGFAHAVDIVPLVGGRISWAWPHYHPLAAAMKEAARIEAVPVEWGGDWKNHKDGPHWQLPWSAYPAAAPVVAREPRMAPALEQDLARSRTMQGAGVAAAGGAAVLAEPASEVVDAVVSQQWALASGDWVMIAIGVVVIAGAAWAAYARWDDAGRPVPWRS